MKVLSVFIQHDKASLDRPFSYLYDGERKVGPLFRVLVPFHGQKIMGFVSSVYETGLSKEELEETNGFALSYIYDVVDEEPLLNDELNALSDEVAAYYLSPKVAVLSSMLPSSLRPNRSALRGPKVAYDKFVEIVDADESLLTSAKQVELLRLIASRGRVLKKDCASISALKKLLELKKVKYVNVEKERFHIQEFEKEEAHPLTFDQRAAYEAVLGSEKSVALLEGVTGSGKTEVYLHLSEAFLSKGKNVLMLVPEISLTPIMVEYFSRRFHDDVAILHSGLTPAEKYDEYRKIASGRAHIVIGARSARKHTMRGRTGR